MLVFQVDVLELDQTDDVDRVVLHVNRLSETVHGHSLGALPGEEA